MECLGRAASSNWLCVCTEDACDAKYVTAGTVINTRSGGPCGAQWERGGFPAARSQVEHAEHASTDALRGLPVESCQEGTNPDFIGRWRYRVQDVQDNSCESPRIVSPTSAKDENVDTVVFDDVDFDDEADLDLEIAGEPEDFQRSRETVGRWAASPAPGERVKAPVILNVYDLGHTMLARSYNHITKEYGAFHTGIEVYGSEWSFGMTADDTTGIWSCKPRKDPEHTFREAIPVGHTNLSRCEVAVLVERVQKQWPGQTYNVLSRNCHHFAADFCSELGCGPVPPWINALATQSRMSWLEPAISSGRRDGSNQQSDSFFGSLPCLVASVEMTFANWFGAGPATKALPENSNSSAGVSSTERAKRYVDL
eukprot:gnl/MRDRNA2_/MRDRNA2_129380_c0_seq1.p1 gnl/MRDRNA2_/MRDRNA2_129380_c0~~gnl/MRDRNA2_/MRDRNA2_129380_c0_seq1.p1  ORF type:complete len:369 (+),score=57.99 gnl/MRDRNA2_/MRDRNA2_129380_c0_seq1:63-1169(+)